MTTPTSDDKWPPELDAMAAATDHHKVLFENDRVRVLDSRVAPGDQTPVHTHRWPGVLYIIGSSDFLRYDGGGNVVLDSRESDKKAVSGSAMWTDSLTPHFVRNVGTEEIRVIAVELKD